jgi:hypothetical protein
MDDQTREALLAALGQAIKYAASTPEGQRLIGEAKDAIIENTPGVLGAVARGLAALVPHEVPGAVRLNHDGPG